jgi:hypothetical protein
VLPISYQIWSEFQKLLSFYYISLESWRLLLK